MYRAQGEVSIYWQRRGSFIRFFLIYRNNFLYFANTGPGIENRKSKKLSQNISFWMKGRRENILINCIDKISGFIFCGNWNFKYTFRKANLREHCTKYVQETKRIFYQKNHHNCRRQVKTGKKVSQTWRRSFLQWKEWFQVISCRKFNRDFWLAQEMKFPITDNKGTWRFSCEKRKELFKDSVFIIID